MPGFYFRNFLRLIALMAAALAVAGVVTLGYLFSAGDYVARPGTPAYYLGISPLVRDLQAPASARDLEYFGSVGDGNKAAQSQLSFSVPYEAADAVWNEMNRQLQNLALHSIDTRGEASITSNKNVVSPGTREARYTSSKQDLVVLTTYQDGDAGTSPIRFEITHFD